MRRTSLLIACWLLACGTPEAPAPVPAPPPAPTHVAEVIPTPPVPRTPGALEPSAWTFFDPPGPMTCGLGGDGLSSECDPHIVGAPRLYRIEGDRLTRVDDGAVVYDVALDLPAGSHDAVIALDADLDELRIAAVTSDGGIAVVRKRADDGTTLGAYLVASPGAPATRVQIDASLDAIVLRALADRPWSAMLDANDDALLDVREVGIELSALSPDAPRAWTHASGPLTVGDITLRRGEARSRGAHEWRTPLRDLFGCGAYVLFEVDAELAVISHCGATSGADLFFLDRATGAVLARTTAGTIGTIGHSMYHASIDAAYEDGSIYVRGNESGGTYVCVTDARAHRLRACLVHRR